MPADHFQPVRFPAWLAWGFVIATAVTVLTWELGTFRTLGSHEALAAVPAREMLHSGDWIVPRYAGVPRLEKPPLAYWVIGAIAGLVGEFSEFTVRLHSAIAALGLLALMSVWAGRWYGRGAALGAALVQAIATWPISYGRRAEIDMLLCLFIALTLFLIANQPDDESASRRRWRWFAIESLLGLMWLAKFHYGPAMVMGPTFVFWAWRKQWSRFWDLLNPAGMLVAAACVFAWPWLVLQRLPEATAIWQGETVGRAMGELGDDPWWIYLPSLLVLTMPWTFDIVLAAPRSWARAWKHFDERERFVWSWLLVDLAIAWASPDKHENYLLAALPSLTLLASQRLARLTARAHRGVIHLPRGVMASAVAGSIAASAAFWFIFAPRWPAAEITVRLMSVVLLFGLLTACVWLSRRQISLAGWTTLGTLLVCFVIVAGPVWRAGDHRAPFAEFAWQLRRDVLRDEPVWVFGMSGVFPQTHPIAFYLDEPVRRADSIAELAIAVRERGELTAVIGEPFLAEVERIAAVSVLRSMGHDGNHPPWLPLLKGGKKTRLREPLVVCARLRSRTESDGAPRGSLATRARDKHQIELRR